MELLVPPFWSIPLKKIIKDILSIVEWFSWLSIHLPHAEMFF